MTLDETRQLGIEFERRVQTMIPETEIVSKLDTQTIYSYLNQYQDRFISDIYKALDNIPTPSKPSAYVESILRTLLRENKQSVSSVDNKYSVILPEDFGLYLSSKTIVDDSYSYKKQSKSDGAIPNVLVTKTAADQLLNNRPQDNMRIMRNPMAYMQEGSMYVMHDRYTTPKACHLSYYKIPKYMDLFKRSECELPMDVFEDLVSGAVDLYVQYVAGAEARKRQMQEQQKQNRKDREE